MTFAYWMILVAIILPYVMTGLAKSAGYDNALPRAAMDKLQGWRQRADWAHRNHFEALPALIAGVMVAELSHVAQPRIDRLAGLFILFRIAYSAAYLADRPTLRSGCWAGGIVCVFLLFVFAT